MITNLTSRSLLIIDDSTKQPIELPLHLQAEILAPLVNLKQWIKKRIRGGGKPPRDILPGGKIKFAFFPKQSESRDIKIEYNADGKIVGGMLGGTAQAPLNYVQGIGSTYGVKLVLDEMELMGGVFVKHIFSKDDLRGKSVNTLLAKKIADQLADQLENNLILLKVGYADAFGKIGNAAKNSKSANYKLPTSGIGKRILSKTYGVTAADGVTILKDIRDRLAYRDKIGLKDGVESNYPFARGLNSPKSTLIEVSPDVNDALLATLQDSNNGFVVGLGSNKERGIITSISYNGKTIGVEVVDDMPQKSNKDFNWSIVEVGKHGATALYSHWGEKMLVRPSYELTVLQFITLEMQMPIWGVAHLQPELNFASFKA